METVNARIKEEKKPKSKVRSENIKTIRVEEVTLSAGIDDYIQSQLNRDYLNQDYCGLGSFNKD